MGYDGTVNVTACTASEPYNVSGCAAVPDKTSSAVVLGVGFGLLVSGLFVALGY